MIFRTYSNLRQTSRLLSNKNNCVAIKRFISAGAIVRKYSKVERGRGVDSIDVSPAFRDVCQSKTNVTEVRIDKTLKNNNNDDPSCDGCKLPKSLDICTEDLSHIHSAPSISYNVAKYANQFHIIRELIKLGVKVYKLDGDTALAEFYLTRDFDKDVKPYIQFLYDNGVPANLIGQVLSKNLHLLKSDLDDLCNRVNYMKSHKFTTEMITAMIVKHPLWLTQRIEIMDANLGYVQNAIKASGQEVRIMTILNPVILTSNKFVLSKIMFGMTKEMGFSRQNLKAMFVREPTILTSERQQLLETFNYLHNEMKLSHEVIAQEPRIMLFKKDKIRRRHVFLKTLGRAQFDPTKPLYVLPLMFVRMSDEEFCNIVCKCSTEMYYQFVKFL